MKKKPPPRDVPPPNNPFGALAGLRDQLPAGAAAAQGTAAPPRTAAPPGAAPKAGASPPAASASRSPAAGADAGLAPRGPARAVVRMERKGRGGKEVTAVEQLGLRAPELESWLKALKNALGCGGTVEKDVLLLQGDQRERVKPLLEARGVRRVILG